jgi:hypothetical protein
MSARFVEQQREQRVIVGALVVLAVSLLLVYGVIPVVRLASARERQIDATRARAALLGGYAAAAPRLEQAAARDEAWLATATRRVLHATSEPIAASALQSLMQDAALKKATAIAGATTGAVKNVEQQGYARKMDAVGLGKGIVGSQATMQQIAQSGGAQAVNASGAAIGAGRQSLLDLEQQMKAIGAKAAHTIATDINSVFLDFNLSSGLITV